MKANITLTIPTNVPAELSPDELETLRRSLTAHMPNSVPLSATDPAQVVIISEPVTNAKAQIEYDA